MLYYDRILNKTTLTKNKYTSDGALHAEAALTLMMFHIRITKKSTLTVKAATMAIMNCKQPCSLIASKIIFENRGDTGILDICFPKAVITARSFPKKKVTTLLIVTTMLNINLLLS